MNIVFLVGLPAKVDWLLIKAEKAIRYMIRLSSTRYYQDKVDYIYRQLLSDKSDNLKLFEYRYRMIHVYNAKIVNMSADLGKPEGIYDTL